MNEEAKLEQRRELARAAHFASDFKDEMLRNLLGEAYVLGTKSEETENPFQQMDKIVDLARTMATYLEAERDHLEADRAFRIFCALEEAETKRADRLLAKWKAASRPLDAEGGSDD